MGPTMASLENLVSSKPGMGAVSKTLCSRIWLTSRCLLSTGWDLEKGMKLGPAIPLLT